MVGLLFEMLQLMWYGFGSQTWMMWAAGFLAAISSITYPAISAFVSMHADADKQGLVQGMITGMRGLCNGLGPAMFGLIFNLFHVDLSEKKEDDIPVTPVEEDANSTVMEVPQSFLMVAQIVPGPPFVFGALLVILALMVAAFIPENMRGSNPGSRGPDDPNHSTSSKRLHHDTIKKSDDDFDDYEGDESDGEFRVPLMESAKGGVL